MLAQVWALLLLKGQIFAHTFSSGKALSLAIGLVLLVFGLVGAAVLGVAMFYLGANMLQDVEPLLRLLILDGLVVLFLMFWLWGLLLEIQRSEIIDLRKMLYLPVSLRMIFFLNFATSLFSLPLLLFAPAALGLLAGLTFSFGGVALLGGALALFFFLLVSAWAYYVRGMLAIFMENKRRRRLIMTVLPISFVLLAQLPSLLMHEFANGSESARRDFSRFRTQDEFTPAIVWANLLFPPAWLPLGTWFLLEDRPVPAACCLAGLACCTGMGLSLGYRSTLRYHSGAGRVKARRQRARRRNKRLLTTWRLPLLSDETAAITLANFLTFARHPNIRMMLVMPLCLGLFFVFFYGTEFSKFMGGERRNWFPLFILVWPFLNFGFILLNVFGVDRQSFRAMVLLPTPRHRYLIAKNLALFPFVGGLSLLFVSIGVAMAHQPWQWTVVAVLQVFQVYLSFCTVGNFTSIYFPYRIHADGMRNQNNRPIMILISFASMGLVALLMLPSGLCLALDSFLADYYGVHLPLGILASLLILALTSGLYALSLRYAGDLLLLREHRILEALVRDRE